MYRDQYFSDQLIGIFELDLLSGEYFKAVESKTEECKEVHNICIVNENNNTDLVLTDNCSRQAQIVKEIQNKPCRS